MLFASVICFALFGISQASGNGLVPRTITAGPNATSTSDGPVEPTSSLTCCYLSDVGVEKLIWYTGSVEVIVATVSTIVYQYDNTAITSYQTIKANSTTAFPTDYWDNFSDYTIPGVPTDIIGTGRGPYPARSTVMYGTAWTDPYGVVYPSPTPVWDFGYVSYASFYPTESDGVYACPTVAFNSYGAENDGMKPYPSGCYLADDDPTYGQNNTGELFTKLPAGLRDWMVSHVPPNTSSYWSELAGCTMGAGDGIPIAHIPVTELTASRLTTSTLTGDYGKPTAIPVTSPPAAPVSTPENPPPVSTPVTSPTPPSDTPPADTPPAETPGNGNGNNPPANTPPADTPPETSPSTVPQNPPADNPSDDTPPAGASGNANTAANPAAPPPTPTPVFTAGGSTFTVNPSTGVVIGGSTLTPGGTITVPGDSGPTTFILPSTGSSIIINGATQVLTPAAGTTPFILIDGTTFFPNSASGFVIGSQTLTPGGVITQAGETISLAPGGSSIVVAEGTETMTAGLGSIIASQGGFATSKPSGYEGPLASSAVVGIGLDVRIMGCVLGMGVMFIWAL